MAKIKNNNNMHVSYYYYYLSCAHDILFTTKTVFQFNFFFFNYFCHFSAARLKALNGIERFISTNNSTKTRFYINQPSNARLLMLNCVCLYIGY